MGAVLPRSRPARVRRQLAEASRTDADGEIISGRSSSKSISGRPGHGRHLHRFSRGANSPRPGRPPRGSGPGLEQSQSRSTHPAVPSGAPGRRHGRCARTDPPGRRNGDRNAKMVTRAKRRRRALQAGGRDPVAAALLTDERNWRTPRRIRPPGGDGRQGGRGVRYFTLPHRGDRRHRE